jgi:hypothetical protein
MPLGPRCLYGFLRRIVNRLDRSDILCATLFKKEGFVRNQSITCGKFYLQVRSDRAS